MRLAKFVIIGKDNCIWCDRAKELLQSLGVSFEYKDLDKDTGAFLVNQGIKTVPAIWVESRFIGGFRELEKYFKENNDR